MLRLAKYKTHVIHLVALRLWRIHADRNYFTLETKNAAELSQRPRPALLTRLGEWVEKHISVHRSKRVSRRHNNAEKKKEVSKAAQSYSYA